MYRSVEGCQRQRAEHRRNPLEPRGFTMSHAARTRTRAAFAAALSAGVLLTCARAFACSCIERSPAEAFAQAVSVFEGHVREIVEPPADAEGAANVITVRLAVVRSWKGMEQE